MAGETVTPPNLRRRKEMLDAIIALEGGGGGGGGPLTDGSVTTAKLADGAATGSKLGSDVITSMAVVKAGYPTASDIPSGRWAVYKDSTNGTLRVWANDGGVIRSASLEAHGGHGVVTINVQDYGADPTGLLDSSTAINAAIAALPDTGGEIYFPAGNYQCANTIAIGNGSTSGVSTRTGVVLRGSAPGPWMASGSTVLNPRGVFNQGTTRLFAAGASVLVQIRGPLEGWGLHDLHLDGMATANVGLDEVACRDGQSSGVLITGCLLHGQRTRSLPLAGALVNAAPNHELNRYERFCVGVPAVTGARGITVDGSTDSLTDSWGDVWDHLQVFFQGNIADGAVTYGVYLLSCDNESFNNVFFGYGGAKITGTGIYRPIVFDYNNSWSGVLPGNVQFDYVDLYQSRQLNSTVQPVLNAGTPAGNGLVNRIRRISTTNGVSPNPLVANLEWEGCRAKAGAPVAAEIATGTGGIWKNTTSGAVAYYYNDAGTLKSVALA